MSVKKRDLEGYLEKRGAGTIGLAWKRRWFALEESNLYYYDLREENKDYRGFIDISEVTEIAPRIEENAITPI